MEEMSETLRSVPDFTHIFVHGDHAHENKLVGHDDRVALLKGIFLDFPHFDGEI